MLSFLSFYTSVHSPVFALADLPILSIATGADFYKIVFHNTMSTAQMQLDIFNAASYTMTKIFGQIQINFEFAPWFNSMSRVDMTSKSAACLQSFLSSELLND